VVGLGCSAKKTQRQGTAVTKKYQTTVPDATALALPDQVSIAMDQIAADMREGLLALAVGAGLQVMGQLMEADVTAACGPKGKHDPDRDRDPARHRGRVGDPGRPAGAGAAPAGPLRRRLWRVAGAGL